MSLIRSINSKKLSIEPVFPVENLTLYKLISKHKFCFILHIGIWMLCLRNCKHTVKNVLSCNFANWILTITTLVTSYCAWFLQELEWKLPEKGVFNFQFAVKYWALCSRVFIKNAPGEDLFVQFICSSDDLFITTWLIKSFM